MVTDAEMIRYISETQGVPAHAVLAGLANPAEAEEQLAAMDSVDSLLDFVRMFWHVNDPGQPLIVDKAMEAVCEHLEAVHNGQIKNLLINIPPGFSKSVLTSVYFPAWEWGPRNQPHNRYVSISHMQELAKRDNRRCSAIIRDELYRKYWGDLHADFFDEESEGFGDWVAIDPKQQSAIRFANTRAGWKWACSISGGITGQRGNRVIIDDPLDVGDSDSSAVKDKVLQTFTEVIPTRRQNPDDPMIVIMQRIAEDDLSGHILSHLRHLWDCLILPMRWEEDHPFIDFGRPMTSIGFRDWRTEPGELLSPARINEDQLNELEETMSSSLGEFGAAGQLQQRPIQRGGGLLESLDTIPRGDLPFEIMIDGSVIGSDGSLAARRIGWDFAATDPKKRKGSDPDWTVAVDIVLYRGTYYVIDVWRDRKEAGLIMLKFANIVRSKGLLAKHSIPRDPGASGKFTVRHMIAECPGHLIDSSPETGDKTKRFLPVVTQAKAGNFLVVEAPWTTAYKSEMLKFPFVKHDDQVDATSRAAGELMREAMKPRPRGLSTKPATVARY